MTDRASHPSDSFRIGALPLACPTCAGEGRIWASKYGGNDPDVWDAGPCEECNGTGDHACEYCAKHPAIATWTVRGRTHLICRACHDEWVEDAA